MTSNARSAKVGRPALLLARPLQPTDSPIGLEQKATWSQPTDTVPALVNIILVELRAVNEGLWTVKENTGGLGPMGREKSS